MTNRASRCANLLERSQRHVGALARRQLGEQQDHRRVAEAMTVPKAAAIRRRVELASGRSGSAGRVMRSSATPSAESCARSASLTASTRAAPSRYPRPAVASKICLARNRRSMSGAVRGEIRRRELAPGQDAGRRRHRQVAAGVQMRDVGAPRHGAQRTAEAVGGEELPVIGQPVREIPQDPDVEGPRPGVGRMGRPGARLLIAGIGRADRHLVSPSGQPARERGRDAGDSTVGPRVLIVGDDVQDPERGHGQIGAV